MTISGDVNSQTAQKPGPTHPPTDEELERAVAELKRAGILGPDESTRGRAWMGDY